jgi:hypothetical protein
VGDAQVAYYVMLKWTRVAASETHELLFRPSRTRFPEHHNGATPSPHQPPTLIFSSLFHCDRHYRVRRSTASDYPLTPGKPAGATAQLHTLLPTSATTALTLTTTADGHSTTPGHTSPPPETTQWLASRPPPVSSASSPNRIQPCAHSPSSG